ncbi:MAG: hypothetical protein PHE51_03045 [Eubacteriales bacterium]|nr:hypothetical protein [Eubacteriales bacterium]
MDELKESKVNDPKVYVYTSSLKPSLSHFLLRKTLAFRLMVATFTIVNVL